MFLLEILAALALMQFWRGSNPLHHSEWFEKWVKAFDRWPQLAEHGYLHLLVIVAVPVLVVAVIIGLVPGAIAFLLGTLVLIYCLGRGELGEEVDPYMSGCSEGDWERASRACARQGADLTSVSEGDWSALHEKMLEAAAYHGFERLFAVIFWFVLLGPIGALLYRLSHAFASTHPSEVARHWLWAMEWMPARVLGASFAVTGNFVGCVNRWREHVLNAQSSAGHVLVQSVLGALSVDDELMASCDVTEREIAAIKRLYRRTLWFWLALLALWVIFGPARFIHM